jgi:ComEC/Rec2-related protein
MMINRIIVLSIGFIAGIVLATICDLNFPFVGYLSLGLVLSGIACCAYTIYGEYKWREYSRIVIFLPLIIAGLSLGIFRTNSVLYSDSPSIRFFDSLRKNELIDIKGKIVAEPELRSSHTLNLRVRVYKIKRDAESEWQDVPPEDIRVTVSKPRSKSKWEQFEKLADSRSYGYDIEFKSSYQPVSGAKNPGGFNMKAFLLAEGCIADLKVNNWRQPKHLKGSIENVTPAKGFFLLEWALAAKRSFLRTYRYSILPPASRLISGATLGTRFALRGKKYKGDLIEDFFRHSGVGHVLAVSGLHVSVVSLLLYSLLKMSRIPPKYFAPVLIVLLFSFVLLTGARPSSLRASIMNSVIILIFVYGGNGFKKATYAGLAISAFLILLRRPMVLYSAGFLLSFGAVLSLVLISPPIEKILNQLRGAVFALVLSWYAGILVFACRQWETFLRWEVIILLIMFLWLLISIGAIVNRKFPILLKFRFDRIPSIIRVFLAAQLAIQFGMMIPMSAYFFGNFPIAGMFVNLIAIPLVGVIVQLGILIGLAGMVPGLWWLAFIFGAAAWGMGYIFIFSAWLGSVVFPYPPVPKPSVTWMVVYYCFILFLLSMQLFYAKIQTFVYSFKYRSPGLFNSALLIFCLAITGPSLYMCAFPSESESVTIDILSGTSTPVIVLTGEREGAVVINAGNSFFASRNLKNVLLARNTISVQSAFCSGRAPDDGAEGFAVLSESIPLDKVFYPAFDSVEKEIFKEEWENEEYKAYIRAIGIDTDKKIKSRKYSWLRKCGLAFQKLNNSKKGNIVFYSPKTKYNLSGQSEISVLRKPYETYPVTLNLMVMDKNILIVGDPSSRYLPSVPETQLQCDYLVIPVPSSSRTEYYMKGLAKLLSKTKPSFIVICADNERYSESREKIIESISSLCKGYTVKRTDMDNVSFSFSRQ